MDVIKETLHVLKAVNTRSPPKGLNFYCIQLQIHIQLCFMAHLHHLAFATFVFQGNQSTKIGHKWVFPLQFCHQSRRRRRRPPDFSLINNSIRL